MIHTQFLNLSCILLRYVSPVSPAVVVLWCVLLFLYLSCILLRLQFVRFFVPQRILQELSSQVMPARQTKGKRKPPLGEEAPENDSSSSSSAPEPSPLSTEVSEVITPSSLTSPKTKLFLGVARKKAEEEEVVAKREASLEARLLKKTAETVSKAVEASNQSLLASLLPLLEAKDKAHKEIEAKMATMVKEKAGREAVVMEAAARKGKEDAEAALALHLPARDLVAASDARLRGAQRDGPRMEAFHRLLVEQGQATPAEAERMTRALQLGHQVGSPLDGFSSYSPSAGVWGSGGSVVQGLNTKAANHSWSWKAKTGTCGVAKAKAEK